MKKKIYITLGCGLLILDAIMILENNILGIIIFVIICTYFLGKYLSIIQSEAKEKLKKEQQLEQEKILSQIRESNKSQVQPIEEEIQEEIIKEIPEIPLNKWSIEYVDRLDGLEFEKYIAELLKELGYENVKITSATGDFGIDVLAEKDSVKYAIQCKNYNNVLGNKCVQEAYSGKQYYNCHVGIVATNSNFTSHAEDLAKKNNIILWNRKTLKNMLKIVQEKEDNNNG